jgi:hypothetical protein
MLEMLFVLAPWWGMMALIVVGLGIRMQLRYKSYMKVRREVPGFAAAWERYEDAQRVAQTALLLLMGVTVVMVIMVMMLHGS